MNPQRSDPASYARARDIVTKFTFAVSHLNIADALHYSSLSNLNLCDVCLASLDLFLESGSQVFNFVNSILIPVHLSLISHLKNGWWHISFV